MIEYLRHLAVFSHVAQEGSFSEAARRLGIAPSRVSESVSKLEHYVGVTLISRTTRKIALTSEGRRLFAQTSGLLEGAEQGLNDLRGTKSEPIGSLRISVPSYLSSSTLTQAMGQFVAAHPHVQITADFTDNDVDPVKDGYDMCILAGQFDKRKVTTRALGAFDRALYVGQGYLDNQKPAEHPKDLMEWDWINYRHSKRTINLKSDVGGSAKLVIQSQARLQVDTIDALYAFTCMDLGVALLPVAFAQQKNQPGAPVRLFEHWHLPAVKYSAVWPDTSNRKSLISVFVEFLESCLVQND